MSLYTNEMDCDLELLNDVWGRNQYLTPPTSPNGLYILEDLPDLGYEVVTDVLTTCDSRCIPEMLASVLESDSFLPRALSEPCQTRHSYSFSLPCDSECEENGEIIPQDCFWQENIIPSCLQSEGFGTSSEDDSLAVLNGSLTDHCYGQKNESYGLPTPSESGTEDSDEQKVNEVKLVKVLTHKDSPKLDKDFQKSLSLALSSYQKRGKDLQENDVLDVIVPSTSGDKKYRMQVSSPLPAATGDKKLLTTKDRKPIVLRLKKNEEWETKPVQIKSPITKRPAKTTVTTRKRRNVQKRRRRKGSLSSSEEDDESSERKQRTRKHDHPNRNAHNNLERIRRVHLKESFDTLRELVPALKDKKEKKCPKVMTLQESASFCRHLTNEDKRLEMEKRKMLARNRHLKHMLERLKNKQC